MSERATHSLLRDLSSNLAPVRPIPRLRTVLAVLAALCGAVLVTQAVLGASPPLQTRGDLWLDPVFLAVLLGLSLSAAGGIARALAGAVPGREKAARRGRDVFVAGAVVASSAGLWAVVRADFVEPSLVFATSARCFGRASALGLVPSVFLCGFLARAFERRALLGAAFACVGGVALGAVAVHTTCADGRALHLLVGHWLTPFAIALMLALPLSLLVRRLSLRS